MICRCGLTFWKACYTSKQHLPFVIMRGDIFLIGCMDGSLNPEQLLQASGYRLPKCSPAVKRFNAVFKEILFFFFFFPLSQFSCFRLLALYFSTVGLSRWQKYALLLLLLVSVTCRQIVNTCVWMCHRVEWHAMIFFLHAWLSQPVSRNLWNRISMNICYQFRINI